MNAQTLVAKVWNFAHVLRDQGVSYQAYISQISYLLFLKMDEERVTQIGEASMLPDGARWSDIKDLTGEALSLRYTRLLETLSKQGGIIGAIFLKAQNEIQDPAKLRRLVGLIDSEVWLGLPVDVKGDIYEGLLARNAEDVKSGAGQYFTPRSVIEAMVEVVDPQPDQTVHDPACGTAGFLLAAWEHMKRNPKARDRAVYSALKNKFSGVDIVPEVVRLAAMNLYLHGITGVDSIVEAKDALLGAGGKSYEIVLTNPPFGRKQSYRIVRDDGEIDSEREDYDRQDFFVTTSNKQLNFLQHIMTVLAPEGEAAVVLPDNVLFEGGAGETIRRRLLKNFDFHTLLRLPTGIFYKQGVKANVLFFDKKPPSETAATKDLWIYDLRTNKRFTLKERPMAKSDLLDFIESYRSGRRREREQAERFRRFPLETLLARDKVNLDIFWLKDDTLDDPDLLPPPDEVAAEIVESLQTAIDRFRGVATALSGTQT
ncbi:MAG: SAM-dependent DNA methyltransferase [Mesorhizobium sp.]|uniref:site-specific DNA-methyltransferase (adenine-specific) n=1 Tax=Mesorhizobium shonense TaxID=1209948 RepID=A0ABV2HWG6_9HYPH|nr:class I SAM-dependent DNA methyltransferase [Mesorhizobium sp.]RWB99697.1 MAG: SAM-dependent DNA methyltransferase [Mesorhizobium sp.]